MQCLYVPVGDSLESAKKVHVIFVPDFEVSKFKEKETTCLLKIVKNEEDDITGVPI
jgi:hypothetical protein